MSRCSVVRRRQHARPPPSSQRPRNPRGYGSAWATVCARDSGIYRIVAGRPRWVPDCAAQGASSWPQDCRGSPSGSAAGRRRHWYEPVSSARRIRAHPAASRAPHHTTGTGVDPGDHVRHVWWSARRARHVRRGLSGGVPGRVAAAGSAQRASRCRLTVLTVHPVCVESDLAALATRDRRAGLISLKLHRRDGTRRASSPGHTAGDAGGLVAERTGRTAAVGGLSPRGLVVQMVLNSDAILTASQGRRPHATILPRRVGNVALILLKLRSR